MKFSMTITSLLLGSIVFQGDLEVPNIEEDQFKGIDVSDVMLAGLMQKEPDLAVEVLSANEIETLFVEDALCIRSIYENIETFRTEIRLT